LVLTNEMRTTLDAGGAARGAARALTLMLAPFAPFAAEELWRVDLGEASSTWVASWPTFDPAMTVEELVTMIVQVDGKLRDKLEVPTGISDQDALAAARDAQGAQRALAGREVLKEIVRAPKLVNFVTHG
jgi:leucyl-tRNA synthetase